MKKKILSIACVLVSAITFAQVPTSVPTGGLIAYYPFDGNANDESGNGHHGTVDGAVLSQDSSGTVNGAYYFDGDDKITINHHSDFNISNLTFSITYKAINYPNAIPNGNSVFLSKREPSGWGSSFEFSPDIEQYAFGYSNSISGNFSGGAGEDNFNTWKTVFYVHDNDSIKVYLDGEIIQEISSPGSFNSNTLDVTIGMRGNGFHGFKGHISNIALWNRALSDSELYDLYNGTENNISCTDTVLITVQDTLNIYLSSIITTVYEPADAATTVKVYPNPTENEVTVSIDNYTNLSGVTLKVINSQSAEVHSEAVTGPTQSIDVSSWSAGIYFLQVLNGTDIVDIRKIVVNN